MSAFSRRGACPALSAPMPTGDGLLVRLAPLAGGFLPAALSGLCKAAATHGNGIVEVTARGSFQIRGLTALSAALLAGDVDGLGIALRAGVPVETGPLAGLDPDEIADPRLLASRIRAAVEGKGTDRLLGPKVSIVVDGGGRSGLSGIAADVRLAAARHDGGTLWSVAVGGNARDAHFLATLPAEGAVPLAVAVIEAVAAIGPAGRARDIRDGLLLRLVSSPSMQGISGQAPGSGQGGEALPPSIFRLRDGRWALAAAIPFGQIHAESLAAFAAQAEGLGVGEIRPAPQRTLLSLCAGEASARVLQEHAGEIGLIISPDDPRGSISACPGAPACSSGHFAAREIAAAIASQHGDVLDGSLHLHLSGCAKGCAHPAATAMAMVGSEGVAGLVIAGTPRSTPVAEVPADDSVASFGRVASLIRSRRRSGESAAACAARLGRATVAAAFAKG